MNRYALEDDRLWNALRRGDDAITARENYDAAIEIARALDIDPATDDLSTNHFPMFAQAFNAAMQVSTNKNLQTLNTDEFDRMMDSNSFNMVNDALMQKHKRPHTTVRDAYKIYQDEIIVTDLMSKSKGQLRKWRNPRDASINLFVGLVGDKDITKITREDALKFFRYVQGLVTGGKIGANAANKKMTPMRKLFELYMRYIGEFDVQNPFDRLHFKEGPTKKHRRSHRNG